jgi:hypothetical protein
MQRLSCRSWHPLDHLLVACLLIWCHSVALHKQCGQMFVSGAVGQSECVEQGLASCLPVAEQLQTGLCTSAVFANNSRSSGSPSAFTLCLVKAVIGTVVVALITHPDC